MPRLLLIAIMVCLAACDVDVRLGARGADADSGPGPETGPGPGDGGGDAGADAGVDAGADAGPDAGEDGGVDAGMVSLRLDFEGPADAICVPALAALEAPLEAEGPEGYNLIDGPISLRLRPMDKIMVASGESIETSFSAMSMEMPQLETPNAPKFFYLGSVPLNRTGPSASQITSAELGLQVFPTVLPGEDGLARLHLVDTTSTGTCTVTFTARLRVL